MLNEAKEINRSFKAPHLERRKGPRFLYALPIEYWRINSSKKRPGHSVNIGECGLMVSLLEQIEVGEKLKVNIFFIDGPDLNGIEATVKVIWSNIDAEKEGYYQHGLKFVDISMVDMRKLKRFLNRFVNS